MRFCMYFIFVRTFEPNKIQTCLAPQNDLRFVKNIHVVSEKMTRSGLKTKEVHVRFCKRLESAALPSGHEPLYLKLPFSIPKFW